MKTGHPASDVRPTARPDGGVRLGWLDALRGVAALMVAVHHGSFHYVPELRGLWAPWIDLGTSGVLVFFLVSGYIIPASLERTGSVRRFWIGRIFRIHPLFIVVVLAAVVLGVTGLSPLRSGLGDTYDPLTATLAHLTTMQDLLGVPSALNVLWTLSYEMAFYLLVVGLFAVGLHRRSASIAVMLAVAGAGLAAVMPAAALTQRFGVVPVVATVAGTMAVAIVLSCSAGRRTGRAGALLGALLAAVLLLVNSRIAVWEGLAFLGFMFTGTAIYRAQAGQIRVRTAAVAAVAVLGGAIGTGMWRIQTWGPGQVEGDLKRAWVLAVVVAAGMFAAGMALRNRPMPGPLTWLGRISYSVYLTHPVLLLVLQLFIPAARVDRPLLLALYLVLVLALAHTTYRLVELPFQRHGRRLARRADPPPGSAAGPSEPEPEPVPAGGRPAPPSEERAVHAAR